MAEKTLTIKKDTLWKVATGIFAVLFIIVLIWNPFGGDKSTGDVITGETTGEYATLQELCASIPFPSWADSEGVIIGSGYKETYSVDDLIEDKISFLYHPGCSWCQKQITFFGDKWQKYIDSGYTIDCSAV